MTSTALLPGLVIGGGSDPNNATIGELSGLNVIYQNLISGGAQTFTGTGSRVLVMDSGAIGTASDVQVGSYVLYGNEATETLAQVSANFETLKRITSYCRANGISVQVDAGLNNGTTFSDGTNALVDQWAPVAAAAGLPIVSVEDVNEQGIVGGTTATMFAHQASIEVSAIQTLIKAYASSAYHMTASNLAVGDMEAGTASSVPGISQWWSAYNSAAQNAGVNAFSFVSAEMGWDAPWLSVQAGSEWQQYISAMSALSKSDHMALDVVVQGMQTDITGSMFVLQQEQHAAQLASFTASAGINVDNILLRTWQPFPVGVNLITAPNSMSNSAAVISATYPLYQAGSITVQACVSVSVPSQAIVTTGLHTSLRALSLHWSQADVLADRKLAVVIIDQTGILDATQFGKGNVSKISSNILILNGDSTDISAEISSITLNEPYSGPDTINVECFGALGQLSDNQINILALADGQPSNLIDTTSTQQGWLSSSAFLNTGTVAAAGSVLTSETLYWNTTGTLVESQGAAPYVKIDSVHEPLAEYGVKKLNIVENGTTIDVLVDYFDASVDDPYLASGKYANNAGNCIQAANDITWEQNTLKVDPFNPAGEVTSFAVTSTINTFDPNNGVLQQSLDVLAPRPLSIVNFYGTAVANTFSTAFDLGGTQVTEFNTGSNPAWQDAWGIDFKFAILTYDHAGQLVEEFLQGGPSEPVYSIDTVYNPVNGQVWEQFQTATPPEGYSLTTGPLYITQFNTGDNPNWDYLDWGNTVAADTEVVSTYLITNNFAGIAFAGLNQTVKFTSGTIYGADNASANMFGSDDIIRLGVNDILHLTGDGNTLVGTVNETVTQNGTGYIDTLGAGSVINNTAAKASFTVNGSGIKVTAAGLDAVTDTGTANSFTFLYGGTFTESGVKASDVVTGNGVTIWLNVAGEALKVSGGSNVITTNINANVGVLGDRNTIGVGNGSTVGLSGNSEVLYGSNTLVNLSTNTTVIANGDGNTLVGTVNETVTQNGTGYIDTLGAGSVINNTAAKASFTVNGSGIKVTAAGGDTVSLTGDGNTLVGTVNETVTQNGTGYIDTLGAGSVINNTAAKASFTVNGSGIKVTAAGGDTVSLTGDGNTLVGTVNETVTQNGTGYIDTLGAGSVINNTAAKASFTVNGSGIKVTAAGLDAVTDTGTANSFTFLYGGTFTESGVKASDVVTGNGVTIWLNVAGEALKVSGGSNVITTNINANVGVLGDRNTIGVGNGSTVGLSGNSEVLYGSNTLVNLSTNTTVTISGTNDAIVVGGTNIGITTSREVISTRSGSSFSLFGSGDTIDLLANSKALLGEVTKVGFITGSVGHDNIITNSGTQIVSGFNMTNGDRLDLSRILTGAAASVTTLNNYIKTTSIGSNTTLTISGPQGSDSVTLAHIGSVSLQSLINNNVFVLPTYNLSVHENSITWAPDASSEQKHVSSFNNVNDERRQADTKYIENHRNGLPAHISRIQVHLRERPNSLTDHEMLEMFLHGVFSGRDTRSIAQVLLTRYYTLGAVVASPVNELAAIDGLGVTGATALKLLHAITVNVLRKEIEASTVLECWDQLIDYLSISLKHERVECFHILFLDNRGALIADEVQANGTINQVSVYPREIVRRCLELHATALIMVHNHPSGDPQPSPQDVTITLAVQRAAAIMGISLHDHIIVGRFGYRSFRQEKLI